MCDQIIVFPKICSICGSKNAQHEIDANGFAEMNEMMCDNCFTALTHIQRATSEKQDREMRKSKLRII